MDSLMMLLSLVIGPNILGNGGVLLYHHDRLL